MKKLLAHFYFLILASASTEVTCHADLTQYQQSLPQKPFVVGQLGEAWQFPSDHLPVGASLGSFHIASWNVLNKDYLKYIKLNNQGLRESSILSDDISLLADSTLTIREQKIVQHIFEMINHPTHPRSLIALQEAHVDLIENLRSELPNNWKIITPLEHPRSEGVFLYDSGVFAFVNISSQEYAHNCPKTIASLTLKEKKSKKLFRFIQSHIPGGADSARGCKMFAEEVLKQFDPSMTILIMGDMNTSPGNILKAFEETATRMKRTQPYKSLRIAYPTHINTSLKASWIDNLFMYTPEKMAIETSQDPVELFEAVQPVVKLFYKAL